MRMAEVVFDKATRLYAGAERPAVDTLDLHIGDGEFLVLVGPSGCGKSTTLRMLAGLEPIDRGQVRIGQRDVTKLDPSDRDIAMVFQTYALYPHMTVRDNMGFALKIAGRPKQEINERVEEAARVLDLTQYLDRKPKALSGGQRQRVAMGRAIVRSPQVFCMDEPLSNLDAKLRVATRTQIASLQRRLAVTTVYVTHDQVEAMTMGDRVAVLKAGLLQQVDTPRNLYERPANTFVAGFIGSPAMNLVTLPVQGEGLRLGAATIPLPSPSRSALSDGHATVGVRPEDLHLVGDGEGIELDVDLVEELGSDAFVYGHVHDPGQIDGQPHELVARVDPKRAPGKGDRVNVCPVPEAVHLFDGTTGERLPA
jgi:multiple sugar transport system ATP-binding protein